MNSQITGGIVPGRLYAEDQWGNVGRIMERAGKRYVFASIASGTFFRKGEAVYVTPAGVATKATVLANAVAPANIDALSSAGYALFISDGENVTLELKGNVANNTAYSNVTMGADYSAAGRFENAIASVAIATDVSASLIEGTGIASEVAQGDRIVTTNGEAIVVATVNANAVKAVCSGTDNASGAATITPIGNRGLKAIANGNSDFTSVFDLTGTVDIAAANVEVVGTDTAFDQQLKVGDQIYITNDAGTNTLATVAVVTNAVHINTNAAVGETTAGTVKAKYQTIPAIVNRQ
jgi:hypothetical protein